MNDLDSKLPAWYLDEYMADMRSKGQTPCDCCYCHETENGICCEYCRKEVK